MASAFRGSEVILLVLFQGASCSYPLRNNVQTQSRVSFTYFDPSKIAFLSQRMTSDSTLHVRSPLRRLVGCRSDQLDVVDNEENKTEGFKGFGEISSTTGGKLDDWDVWMAQMEKEEAEEKARASAPKIKKKPNLLKKAKFENTIQGGAERINKVLSHWGVTSRRGADKYILDGRVKVNGKIVKDLGTRVDPVTDVIAVDGQIVTGEAIVGGLSIEAPKPRWVLLYKPKGVTVTPVPGGNNTKTVLSLVEDSQEDRLLPVGRLDRNTPGLILLTNEREWLHSLTHPRSALGRRYIAVVKGVPKERAMVQLEKGVLPLGYKYPLRASSVDVKSLDTLKRQWTKLELGFATGYSRPRDIRKMLEEVGYPVKTLTRSAVGPFQISKDMKAGDWRDLSTREIDELKQTLRQRSAR